MAANINVSERNTLPVLYNINVSTVILPPHQSIYVIYIVITWTRISLVPSPLPAAIFNGARKVVWHILVEKLGIRKVRQRHHVTRRLVT